MHISNVHADLLSTDVYSGMYARVTVNFFPNDASGNRGVGCGLGAVSVR
nr:MULTISPECIES: ssDNA-binding protein [unclassified Butyricicoccus]